MRLLIGLMTGLVATHVFAQTPASVAQGNYECWGNGSPRLLLNFKVTGKDRYTDPEAKERGSFAYDAGSGSITFKGGHLDGVMPNGFTSIYHENKDRPTVSFRSACLRGFFLRTGWEVADLWRKRLPPRFLEPSRLNPSRRLLVLTCLAMSFRVCPRT